MVFIYILLKRKNFNDNGKLNLCYGYLIDCRPKELKMSIGYRQDFLEKFAKFQNSEILICGG